MDTCSSLGSYQFLLVEFRALFCSHPRDGIRRGWRADGDGTGIVALIKLRTCNTHTHKFYNDKMHGITKCAALVIDRVCVDSFVVLNSFCIFVLQAFAYYVSFYVFDMWQCALPEMIQCKPVAINVWLHWQQWQQPDRRVEILEKEW